MDRPIRFLIITVSDRCSRGEAIDESGPNLAEKIQKDNLGLVEVKCIPDEQLLIERELVAGCGSADVILTTGGTGFSPRDVTPEATKAVIQREAPAIPLAMSLASLAKTKFAVLSRAVCGIRGECLIINLPGSKKGSMECFEAISSALSHAVKLIRNENVAGDHGELSAHFASKVQLGGAANRLRESPWPLISVEEANKIITDNLPAPKSEVITLSGSAVGRVVSEDMYSSEPLPPFPASVKDGYAVLASDGAGPRWVKRAITAGMSPELEDLKPGECVRVNTGGPLPHNADAVVQVEDTRLIEASGDGEEVQIDILIAPKIGLDIRDIGSDIPLRGRILHKGDTLSPIELGLLAATNSVHIPVFRHPRVGVMSTGNEVIEAGSPGRAGAIRDSNRIVLLSLLAENHFPSMDLGIVPDEPSKVMSRLEFGLRNCDVILTTGGVSMGERDFIKEVLVKDFGATIHFGRVNLKPGKPTAFGVCPWKDGSKKVLFCLPGNPVSATVTFQLFVLPGLRGMAGLPLNRRSLTLITVRVRAVLRRPWGRQLKTGFDIVKLDSRPEYKRVVLQWDQEDGIPLALSTGEQISSRLMSWREANGLLILPSSEEHGGPILRGSLLKALLTLRVQ